MPPLNYNCLHTLHFNIKYDLEKKIQALIVLRLGLKLKNSSCGQYSYMVEVVVIKEILELCRAVAYYPSLGNLEKMGLYPSK